MPGAPESPILRPLRRLLPESLGGRLVLTVVLLALTTTLATITISALLTFAQVQSWSRDRALVHVRSFESFLELEGRDLRSTAERFGTDTRLRAEMQAGDADMLTSDFGRRLVDDTSAHAVVVLDETGIVLFSHGPAADIEGLRALVAASPSASVSGMISTAEGTAFVHSTTVRGVSGEAPIGHVAVSRLFGQAQRDEYDTVAGDASATIQPPGYVPRDLSVKSATVDGRSFGFASTPDAQIALADLPSVAGGVAGVAKIADRDTRTREANEAAVVSSLLSGVVAVLIGVGLGVVLTRLMRTPVTRMVDHVKTQGYLSAEGAPYSGEALIDDPTLPLEFRELGAVFEDLLRHLTERQSELKTAVRKAQYAEETLGIVVTESLEAKIVLQDGHIAIVNPAAAFALGLPQTVLFDMTITEAFSGVTIHAEEGAELKALELLEQALDTQLTVALARDDQPERWYTVQAVRHADDVHNRILISARDVTEERRLQSIRAEIVSLVSHDLRSPLSVVIGYLDLLRKPLSDEDRDRAIDSAKRNASRMADLLEDLLSATRAEELLAPSQLVPVRIDALVDEVVGSMAPTHSERHLFFEPQCAPLVLGEEKRLRQVLVNLVTNAFKYSPEPTPIEVQVTCDDNHVFLRVVDQGPGVPAHERDRVFERFARLDGGSARPGLGLGLYIVRIISENHGGCVRVEETPGGGATFVVELPLAGWVVDGEMVLKGEDGASQS